MNRRPPRSTRTDSLCPYTRLFRSWPSAVPRCGHAGVLPAGMRWRAFGGGRDPLGFASRHRPCTSGPTPAPVPGGTARTETGMSEHALDDMDGVGGEPEKKRISGKRLIIFAAILLLVLIGGGVGAAFMLGMFAGGPPPVAEHADAPAVPPAQQHRAFFFEVPDLIVNLNTSGRKSTFLKIKIALELRSPQDVDRINEVLPRIVDNFQVYLRELRVDDLNGSAGMYRLREELLRRVNIAARPVEVRDVLFKEMLVQ